MELHQLKQFVAAAEAESFTRGAERAFVSQPAISASISKLEDEMAAQLFIRNKRSVVLTPAGRKLFKRAKLIISECAKAKDELIHHEVQRSLRLGVINTLAIGPVAKLIEQYRCENPEVLLDVTDASQDQIKKLQKEARIDFALTRLEQGKGKNGRQEILFSEPYVAALSLGHHLSGRTTVSLFELAKEPFIARTYCEIGALICGILKEKRVRLNLIYKTDQDDRAISLVEAGVGVAIIPQHYTSSFITKVRLAEIPTERQIGFEFFSDRNQDEIRKFVDFSKTVPWES